MKPSITARFFRFLVQAHLQFGVRQLATKVQVGGSALKVINAIADSEDELNERRFSRLCGMFRSPDIVWEVLAEHDKADIIRASKERLHEKAHSSAS